MDRVITNQRATTCRNLAIALQALKDAREAYAVGFPNGTTLFNIAFNDLIRPVETAHRVVAMELGVFERETGGDYE